MPASITAEGIHIAIPLFVLFLGGNVADVGVVIAVHYGFSSIGSIFWGKIIDKYHIKKGILVICFSAISLSSLAMFFASEIGTVFVLSAIMGFFIIGKNPVTHLLVMESVPNNQWGVLFSRISIIASFGSLIAFLAGVLRESFFDLRPYFIFCAIASAIAVVLSVTVERKNIIERETLVHSIHGLKHIFYHNFKQGQGKDKNAERGTRTPARLRVAVFETAAVLLGYLGNYHQNNSIIKQIRKE